MKVISLTLLSCTCSQVKMNSRERIKTWGQFTGGIFLSPPLFSYFSHSTSLPLPLFASSSRVHFEFTFSSVSVNEKRKKRVNIFTMEKESENCSHECLIQFHLHSPLQKANCFSRAFSFSWHHKQLLLHFVSTLTCKTPARSSEQCLHSPSPKWSALWVLYSEEAF